MSPSSPSPSPSPSRARLSIPPNGFRNMVSNALGIPSSAAKHWVQLLWDLYSASEDSFLDPASMSALAAELAIAGAETTITIDDDNRAKKDAWVLQNLFSASALARVRSVVDFGGADGWFGKLFLSVSAATQIVVVETDSARFPASGFGVVVVAAAAAASEAQNTVIWDGNAVDDSYVSPGTADVVCFRVSLHHMDAFTQENAVREAFRMLRPGGVCVVKEHDVTSQWAERMSDLQHALFVVRRAATMGDAGVRREDLFEHFWRHEKAHYRSREDWRALFQRAGFRSQGMRDRFGQRIMVHPGSNNLTKLYWEMFLKPPATA